MRQTWPSSVVSKVPAILSHVANCSFRKGLAALAMSLMARVHHRHSGSAVRHSPAHLTRKTSLCRHICQIQHPTKYLSTANTRSEDSSCTALNSTSSVMMRSKPASSMQKTYDECYLICSTAVYFEGQVADVFSDEIVLG